MADEHDNPGVPFHPIESEMGKGVDAAGGPVVDPTKNVLDLVQAANQRQDDLRDLTQKHLREMLDLRTELWTQDYRRQDDLRDGEKEHGREILQLRTELGNQDSRCAGEIAQLRADHTTRIDDIREHHADALRKAEAQRIDAIRSVDVEAVQRAAEVQATQAQTLATQVATTSEAMRAQVAAAATAAQTALAAALEPIIKDIADLRRAQYEAQGQKTQVVETQARGGGVGMWVGLAVAGVVGFVTVIGAVVAIIASQ